MQKLVIDYSDNPELANYIASKSAGDKCEMTFYGKFISDDGGKAELSIDTVGVEYEGEELEVEPTTDEPVEAELLILTEVEEEQSEAGDEMEEEVMLDGEEEEEA